MSGPISPPPKAPRRFGRPQKLSDERELELVRRHQVWLDSSPSKLSAEFGISRESFYRILQRRGVRRS